LKRSQIQRKHRIEEIMNFSFNSDPSLTRDQRSLSGEKRPRQVSIRGEESSASASESSISSANSSVNNKKKKHAHQEKKRRVDLNTCYGELMALLMEVDPELGGSLGRTDKKKSDVPDIVPVKNLLPRRDLINRAVVMMKMIQKENDQLEKIVEQRRNVKLVEVLRKKEETFRRSPPHIDNVWNVEPHLSKRRDVNAQIPQQASIHNTFQQMPNFGIQRREQVEGMHFDAYDIAGRVPLIGNTQQIPQMDNSKQQLNAEALVAYSALLHRLSSHQN